LRTGDPHGHRDVENIDLGCRERRRVREAARIQKGECVVDSHTAELLLDVIGLLGAFIAFTIGLLQYRRAQQWKRAEFLAKEMKELASDVRAATALTMVDWAARGLCLHHFDNSKDETRTVVTYAMQSHALRPHVLDAEREESGRHPESAEDGARLSVYSREETSIRDCYDALLDRMDRLGAYLERRLVSAADLAPYIGYYVNDIAAKTNDATEALWTISLLTYIHFYHFTNIVVLFQAFHHDVSPDGRLFHELMRVVSPQERPLAETLHQLARQECRA
jgi:hypothetical protein